MKILGIETSCDETAAAIVEDGRVVSNVVFSQVVHSEFGGVVPEIASRAHMKAIVPVVGRCLNESGTDLGSIDCIAVTLGPGLIGSLIVGVAFAKSLCLSLNKPLVGVDHIESHIAANYIAYGEIKDPFVCLVASGGHTSLFLVEHDVSIKLLGSTRDDAAGEAFDKVARMLGFDYPGGPEIEREARKGDPEAIDFPRPVMPRAYEFSFSGLKTAVRYYIEKHEGEISPHLRADIAASFQEAVVDVLADRTLNAALDNRVGSISVVGGVASNSHLRQTLKLKAKNHSLTALLPPAELCTDNGAIVAQTGYLHFKKGETTDLSVSPYSTLSHGIWDVA